MKMEERLVKLLREEIMERKNPYGYTTPYSDGKEEGLELAMDMIREEFKEGKRLGDVIIEGIIKGFEPEVDYFIDDNDYAIIIGDRVVEQWFKTREEAQEKLDYLLENFC